MTAPSSRPRDSPGEKTARPFKARRSLTRRLSPRRATPAGLFKGWPGNGPGTRRLQWTTHRGGSWSAAAAAASWGASTCTPWTSLNRGANWRTQSVTSQRAKCSTTQARKREARGTGAGAPSSPQSSRYSILPAAGAAGQHFLLGHPVPVVVQVLGPVAGTPAGLDQEPGFAEDGHLEGQAHHDLHVAFLIQAE